MTVYRRFLWLAELADEAHQLLLGSLNESPELLIDEMDSIEHTKLKSMTIPLIVDSRQRILGVRVGEFPGKDQAPDISRKKYGVRAYESDQKVQELLESLTQTFVSLNIHSDSKSSYPGLIKRDGRECHTGSTYTD